MAIIGLYVIGVAVLVALIFALVWFVFGRGEDLPPIESGTTLTRLPRAGIGGDDVRGLVFAQSFRGYRAVEVDWALEKLAREIDELRDVVHELSGRDVADTGAMPTVRVHETDD
ncbi:DivIVA domain-containing protein [Gordonia liuliyuniae]|uniref:DivIVA domain-containing protein n=1 Tax=Gordonia liuliyuniae TaxID=2911517 RepID=A0ABS9IWX8_9ACTN|nr:DivIVA domain-containing protein [Gordonia liuliyuniae]MCF8590068.1 DivIVA domain-containing protein [Gordonia liuliyuniae]